MWHCNSGQLSSSLKQVRIHGNDLTCMIITSQRPDRKSYLVWKLPWVSLVNHSCWSDQCTIQLTYEKRDHSVVCCVFLHAQISSMARSLILCLKLPLAPYFVCTNSKGSGKKDYTNAQAPLSIHCSPVISTLFTWVAQFAFRFAYGITGSKNLNSFSWNISPHKSNLSMYLSQ